MRKPLLAAYLTVLASLAAAFLALAPAHAGAPAMPAPVPPTVRIVDPALRVNHKKTDQMRGFSIQLARPPESIDSYLQAIDDLADMGCTWVNLAVAGHQNDVHSEAISREYTNTPSDDDIRKIMKRAKDRGMGIMMMPMVLLHNSGSKDWRGVIDPKNWDNWFASYNKFITDMARLAQQGDVDIFVVGSELLSTEPFRDRWIATIKNIKSVYKGKLTYSSNWDHYESVQIWDQLDYVGMNNYYELSQNPKATDEELDKAWDGIKKNLLGFAAKQNKPFMFTEVGWHNLPCTLSEPWNYVAEGNIDNGPQTAAFRSFIRNWEKVPNKQFMGAFIWEWCPLGHATDRGTYSLQDTPALEVVKKWFAQP